MPVPSDEARIKKLDDTAFSPNHVAPSRRSEIILEVRTRLADTIREMGFAYIGPNAERQFNLNRLRFNSIVLHLKEDGYVSHYLELEKPNTETSEMILVKVLAPAGTTPQDAWNNRDKILKMWADAQIPSKS